MEASPTLEAAAPQSRPQAVRDVLDVSVVIPCLNEVESVAECVRQARAGMEKAGYEGEVVVVDNGSTDGSAAAAREAGARVVDESRRGYGSAYRAGFAAARGRFVVMGDADLTYDFSDLPRFLEQLEEGADLVVGSRLKGRMDPGAMPWLHRVIGNPVLTAILNLFFRTGLSDTHCGMRAFRREHLDRMAFRTTGMEFASEQIIRAAKLGLEMKELPIHYRHRAGRSKLSSFEDGWRHLRLLLAHSPRFAFIVPGAVLLALGVLSGLLILSGFEVLGRQWQAHSLAGAAMLTIAGSQVVQIGLFARLFTARYMGEQDPALAEPRVERGLIAGSVLLAVGVVLCGVVVGRWLGTGLGPLHDEKLAITGMTVFTLGIQTFFGALFMSVLALGGRSAGRAWVPRRESRKTALGQLPVAPEESH